MLSEEEEINKLIDEAADEYVPFEETLAQNGITFEEGLLAAEKERRNFFDTLKRCGIAVGDICAISQDIAEKLKVNKNEDMLYLYVSLLSGHILFFDDITDGEQKISLWLDYRKYYNNIRERIKAERVLRQRFNRLLKHKADCSLAEYDREELSLLQEISEVHSFISKNINDTYLENLGELVRKTNSDALYSSIKPYIYSTVIARKYNYMIKHRNYSPNISSVFKRKEYNIDKDNGKNYKKYKECIELYCHMKDIFADETDIALSDYCFINLSNLDEWFYENCEPSELIPVTLKQIIQVHASYLEFWHMELIDNSDISITDILTNAADYVV